MSNLQQKADFTGKSIFIGMDVHAKSWDIAIFLEQQHLRSFHQTPGISKLVSTLQRDYPNADFHCAYEAGFSGFGIQRELTKSGLHCIVVNPADVPQTDKGRKTKTDRGDAKRIGAVLQAGLLSAIYVPDPLTESHRRLVRYRQQLLADLKRCKVRIKHFLFQENIDIPVAYSKGCWSRAFLSWLKEINHEHQASKDTLLKMITQVEMLNTEVVAITRQIHELLESKTYQATAQLLQSIPGIGPIITATLLVEIADIRRFPTFAQLNSFIGLCPGEHSSGEEEHKGHIISRHHASLRALLIEAAWVTIKKDPAMTLAYSELKKNMTGKRAIIRIARKLLNRIYHVWMKQDEYETGIVK